MCVCAQCGLRHSKYSCTEALHTTIGGVPTNMHIHAYIGLDKHVCIGLDKQLYIQHPAMVSV